jgi:hypothetical protein
MIVTCPECEQKLRMNAPVPAGKRVKCPKCAALFTPAGEDEEEAPSPRTAVMPPRPGRSKADPDEDDRPRKRPARQEDDEEEEAPRARSRPRREDDDEEDAPRPRSRRRDDDEEEDDRPRRKRKPAKGGNALLLWGGIGGGVALVCLLGCGGLLFFLYSVGSGAVAKQEAALKEEVGLMKDYVRILTSVKDGNSAKAAVPQLNALAGRFDDYATRIKGLPKIPITEAERIKAKYKPDIDQLGRELPPAMARASIAGAREPSFGPAIQKVSAAIMRAAAAAK